MTKFLILFATTNGQTEKIASAIEDKLRRMGHLIDTLNCKELLPNLRLEEYDGIIVGAPVYAGRFSRTLRKWVKTNTEALSAVPSAFFSVSLGILQKEPEIQKAERDIVQTFFDTTGWQPNRSILFAGSLPYSQYNWFLRYYMRRVARKAGGDTDISRDYEYTNWGEVERFTVEFAHEAVESKATSVSA